MNEQEQTQNYDSVGARHEYVKIISNKLEKKPKKKI